MLYDLALQGLFFFFSLEAPVLFVLTHLRHTLYYDGKRCTHQIAGFFVSEVSKAKD